MNFHYHNAKHVLRIKAGRFADYSVGLLTKNQHKLQSDYRNDDLGYYSCPVLLGSMLNTLGWPSYADFTDYLSHKK